MSYTGLIAETYHTQPGGEQFLDQVVFFNADELAVLVKCELATSDSAIRADGTRYFSTLEFRLKLARLLTHRFRTGAVGARPDLLQQRPIGEQVLQHRRSSGNV